MIQPWRHIVREDKEARKPIQSSVVQEASQRLARGHSLFLSQFNTGPRGRYMSSEVAEAQRDKGINFRSPLKAPRQRQVNQPIVLLIKGSWVQRPW